MSSSEPVETPLADRTCVFGLISGKATLDHSRRQALQKQWLQEEGLVSFRIAVRQIGQFSLLLVALWTFIIF